MEEAEVTTCATSLEAMLLAMRAEDPLLQTGKLSTEYYLHKKQLLCFEPLLQPFDELNPAPSAVSLPRRTSRAPGLRSRRGSHPGHLNR